MATSPKSRGRKSAAKNGKEVVEEVPEEAPASEQEEDEEGYEVESILDAKWAYNRRGKWSYFVHWKGYGSDEDMWIDEDDAGGAEELIKDWHELNDMPRDAKGKKKPAAKKPRGSTAASKDKKRKASSTDGMDVDSPEAEEPPAKKPAKRSAKPPQDSPEPEPEPEATEAEAGEEVAFASMDEYMTKARWDTIIKDIETVEEVGDELVALFTRARLRVQQHRWPQKQVLNSDSGGEMPAIGTSSLIAFYEGHLKWRPNEDD
ncbi:hypothetical protein FRC10_009848 [Ceratobasidium sp. 414]|nr:hypothetical protein FRC10_009848 [Ceratobasidium sp. 414]